jgi:hypothetical protein
VIPDSALHLARLILASALSRGVPLEERYLRLELGIPVLHFRLGERVLRGCHVRLPGDPKVAAFGHAPDVIAVHGSGDRSSRMWPRQRDGHFKIEAITEHVLRLVEAELARAVPELTVPVGVPAGLSGLHVLHLAGVRLGTLPAGSTAEVLLDALDPAERAKMEAKIARGSLIEADLRLMDRSNGYSFGRNGKDRVPRQDAHDPFHIWSDRSLPVLVLGRTVASKVERRFVLILDDHDGTRFTVADPAGEGLAEVTREELTTAWETGAKKGVKWAGSIWVRRREPVIVRGAVGTIH